MFTLFFVVLGSSAALFGPWVEREGPRKAGVVAACCWGGGFFVSAARDLSASDLAAVARFGGHRRLRPRPRLHLAGLDAHQVVSRPARHGDRPRDHGIRRRRDDRHAARGRAHAAVRDAEFGRGVADASSCSARSTSSAMMAGAFGYRLPPPGWTPGAARLDGDRPRATGHGPSRAGGVAWKTRQFWLLWAVLCLNVSAGIGVLGIASPMIQEIFRGRSPRRRRPDSPGCSACSTSAGGSSGPRSRIGSAGRPLTRCSSRLARRCMRARRPPAPLGACALFVGDLLRHPDDVRRRVRHDSGLSRRPLRHRQRQRDSRAAAHGLVDGGHPRAGARELHSRVPDRARRRRVGRLYVHDVRAGRFLGVGFFCNLAVRPVDRGLFTFAPRRPVAQATARPGRMLPASGGLSRSAGCWPVFRSRGASTGHSRW